jgi:uncharacterized protein YqgC (DUF456 family)
MIIVRWMLAAISILVGIAGLVLPILPGWLFFGVAALFLFPNATPSRKIQLKIEQRFPSSKRLLRFFLGVR